MCPCDLGRHRVCGYHAEQIERLYRELRDLELREQQLNLVDYVRLRQVRGALAVEGIRAEIVIHQIKTRGWDEVNAR